MDSIKYNDEFSRVFGSLRVSLTQACNFQCTYCVPQGLSLKKLNSELNAKELFFLTKALIKTAAITKLRLTGGEPLLYGDLKCFLDLLQKLPLKDKSLTTNAVLLEKYLPALWDSGFRRINISLDSLDEKIFLKMSHRKGLDRVLRAIDKALEMGFFLKINMVPMKNLNEEQIVTLLDFCLERNIECRYIELMKMGHIKNVFEKFFISMEELLEKISQKYHFQKRDAPIDSVAQRFEIKGKGFFGIIPNYSAPFCQHCNRLRLTSDGKIYGCISNTRNQSITHLLNCRNYEEELKKILLSAMESKQKTFVGADTYMQQIGG